MSAASEKAIDHLTKNPPAPGSLEEYVLLLAREVEALERQQRLYYGAAAQGQQAYNSWNTLGGQAGQQYSRLDEFMSGLGRNSYGQQGYGSAAKPKSNSSGWRATLGISAPNPSKAEINAAYRKKAKEAHPDQGGSTEAMASLNAARAQALSEVA